VTCLNFLNFLKCQFKEFQGSLRKFPFSWCALTAVPAVSIWQVCAQRQGSPRPLLTSRVWGRGGFQDLKVVALGSKVQAGVANRLWHIWNSLSLMIWSRTWIYQEYTPICGSCGLILCSTINLPYSCRLSVSKVDDGDLAVGFTYLKAGIWSCVRLHNPDGGWKHGTCGGCVHAELEHAMLSNRSLSVQSICQVFLNMRWPAAIHTCQW